jgi:hypothetical protein
VNQIHSRCGEAKVGRTREDSSDQAQSEFHVKPGDSALLLLAWQ